MEDYVDDQKGQEAMREHNHKFKTLKEMIKDGLPKCSWCFMFLHDFIVITKDVLDEFGLNEEEPTFVSKVQKLKIPIEAISHVDKRLFLYNDTTKEMRSKPNKKVWHIMRTKNFKKVLFSLSGTRLGCDLKKYYSELEDVVRLFLNQENNIKTERAYFEDLINHALLKYTKIIDEKIIDKIGAIETNEYEYKH